MPDHTRVSGLQRSELARRAGCNIETVRYYEKVGLLPAPPRTTGGYRTYDASHERRLRFVLRARELGFSLDEIRALLKLVDERDQPCAEIRIVATGHLEKVRSKIADLRRMERVVVGAISQCAQGASVECPVIETLFGETRLN
jgi:MerR family mercuric resistance operon transcriptional regulator